MLQQLLTLARNTFMESIRQPIFVVLLLTTTLALILLPMLAGYTFDDDNKLLLEMGLSTLFLSGVLLAAFTATGVVSNEVENRTVLTVVSKPVSRPLFILGKFLGIAAALGVAFWITSLLFLLTLRHRVMQTASDPFDGPVLTFGGLAVFGSILVAALANYLYARVFASTLVACLFFSLTPAYLLVLLIAKGWTFQTPAVDWSTQNALALLLIFEAVLVLTAVALAASTRLGQVMTLVVCVGVGVLGQVGEYLVQRAARAGGGEDSWARAAVDAIYYAVPNVLFFWVASGLARGNEVSLENVLYVSAYGLLFVIALVSLAIALFQTREVG